MKRIRNISNKIGVLIILIITGCSNHNKVESHITGFDISPDGKYIVYSFGEDKQSASLYQSQIDGGNPKIIAKDSSYSFFNPKFSKDGNTIIFVGNNEKNKKSSIWEVDKNGLSLKKIFEDSGFISEVIYSDYTKAIYFIKANVYDSYSPIAPKAKHDFDIYALDNNDFKPKKISAMAAYSLASLIEVDKDKILIGVRGDEADSGIFFYHKDSKKVEKIVTTNDTLTNSTGYLNPVVLDDGNIICASYYELVSIDLKSKLDEMILPSSGYHFRDIRYNKKLHKIFFARQDRTDDIYITDLDGENLKEVTLVKK